ncbi:Tetratricopeptide repeat-containing protein [Verrucomicrobium sp. GAS474]|uniref:tetratricopeptide repeat protein n=1 Tax=Verrucomicrobium sp. GAS474 TaxID=1882831 RepID=UPI00087DD598|nr:tetratricopeptide repeat protein [Verrucomicrobium sp. GAS474]SDT99972.1 Tetratricopeptide repeat-containing protein [Verrucomicrobium sp. GAS474]
MSAGQTGDPRLQPIIALFQEGRGGEGTSALDRFLAAEPDHVEALALATFCHVRAGNKEAARACVGRAATLGLSHPVALNNLGLLAEEAEAAPGTIAALFRRAAEADPGNGEIADNLERALVAEGLAPGAAAGFWEKELRAYPRMAGLWTGLGNQGLAAGDLAGAGEAFARAAALRPERAETRVNLGIVEHRQGRPEAALRRYAEAAALEGGEGPSSALRWNRALSRLTLGDLENGFADYEARDYLGAYRRLPVPRWTGEPFSGTLLLHAEQGFGDAIQFARYAALAKERGGSVLLACDPLLERLLARVPGVDGIVRASEIDRAAREAAWEAPLLSLPHIVRTRLETIPASVPYLAWDEKPGRTGDRGPLRVGLVASGNPKYGNDLRRSIPPALLAPLAAVPGVRWTGFHHDGCPGGWWEEGLAGLPDGSDFYDTALRLREMDLVISVDTASAHLAGAMGLPLWILLPHAADWRWLRDCADSPWYPTARLFRQPRDGAWDEVVSAVGTALAGFPR